MTVALRFLLIGVFTVAGIGYAQPAERGAYRIVVGRATTGSEDFAISKTEYGLMLTSSGEFNELGITRRITTATVMRDRKLSSYIAEITSEGHTIKYKVEFDDPGASVTIESGELESERRVRLPANVLILDQNVWHHYFLLLYQYDETVGGYQSFNVVVPQGGFVELGAVIRPDGTGTVRIGRERIRGKRYRIELAGGFEVVLIVDEQRVPLSIQIPSSKTVVTRESV